MENSSYSRRKLVLFWVAASSLVLAGMCLNCKSTLPKQPPTLKSITFTYNGNNIESTPTPLAGVLHKSDHDSLQWVNNTDTDLLVIMADDTSAADPAFNTTRFHVPNWGTTPSGGVNPNAGIRDHVYTVQPATLDRSSVASNGNRPPPKIIIVP